MASSPLIFSLLFSLLFSLALHAPTPVAGSCDNYMLYFPQLKPCQGYVQAGNDTVPGPECCGPLAKMTERSGSCFCDFLQVYGKLNDNNNTRISEILILCNVNLPDQAASCLATNGTGSSLPPTKGPTISSEVFPVSYGPASISPPPSNDARHLRSSFMVSFLFLLLSSIYSHAT